MFTIPGIGVHHALEWVFTMGWNRRSESSGIRITVADPDHSIDESRFVLIGRTVGGRTVVVVHTEWGDNIRIISARLATRRESKDYEQGEI